MVLNNAQTRDEKILALQEALDALKAEREAENNETMLVRARRLYREAIESLASENPDSRTFIDESMKEYDAKLEECSDAPRVG